MKICACSAGGSLRRWTKSGRSGGLTGMMFLAAVLAGCQSTPPHASVIGPGYRPNNVFVYPPKLSLDLRRVAVMPLSSETAGGDLPEGCEALAPVLWDALVKTRKFEVVAVNARTLRVRTGQANWTGVENLPPDIFAFFRREYSCDGVLFAELTTYRGDAPMAVGWRLKLVDARSGQIVWTADEVFDTSSVKVARSLQKFGEPPMLWPLFREDNWLAMNSPRQLGRYSAAAMLDTLPER